MEELQSLPPVFQPQQREDFGRRYTTGDPNNTLQLKKFLNAAGKMRADGMSIDAILKVHDLPPGGRNNQNLKMLLDEQAASE